MHLESMAEAERDGRVQFRLAKLPFCELAEDQAAAEKAGIGKTLLLP